MLTREKIERIYQSLSMEYLVPNLIIDDNIENLFLLESPHIKEVLNGYPVASISGYSMSKVVVNDSAIKAPLGKIVYEAHNSQSSLYPNLNKVGLMNACQIPMQLKAYDINSLSEDEKYFIKILEDLRSKLEYKHYNKDHELVREYLMDLFVQNLKQLSSKTITIIPCGKTAREFFQYASYVDEKWNVLLDIPHPSRNSWQWDNNKDLMQQIKVLLNDPS